MKRPGLDILEEQHANRKREGVLPVPRASFRVTPPARIGELGAVIEITSDRAGASNA